LKIAKLWTISPNAVSVQRWNASRAQVPGRHFQVGHGSTMIDVIQGIHFPDIPKFKSDVFLNVDLLDR